MISKIVETNKGLIEGIEEERGYRFLGVPFVKAPIGDLSFKRPQEVEKWSGIYKADKPKANPIQRGGTFSVGYNNQDSLYLNIYVPKIAKEKEKIPVMVWVYGGSYATGGTGLKNDKTLQIEYDSSDFANDTGCIIVNFNYRLNVYGYLNLHSISDDFDLNNGIYDQIAALKFVKENIAFNESLELGMMIETPSVVFRAEAFAREADFFSIGTNDLTQYTLASDRGNEKIASICDPYNPSVLIAIKMAIDGAHANGIIISMCGELAGDLLAVPLLFGLGLDVFSMSAISIPEVKKMIISLDKTECKMLAKRVLTLDTADEVKAELLRFLEIHEKGETISY